MLVDIRNDGLYYEMLYRKFLLKIRDSPFLVLICSNEVLNKDKKFKDA